MYIEDLSEIALPNLATLREEQTLDAVDTDDNAIASVIAGVMSASGISSICTNPDEDVLPTGGRLYIQRKYAHRLNDVPLEKINSRACDHGHKYELEALTAFAKVTGFDLQHTGENQRQLEFGDNLVAHPDAIIFAELDNINFHEIAATVEVKCPFNPEIHQSYLSVDSAAKLKAISLPYYWQIAAQQLCADCDKTYFVSYDPRNEQTPLHFAQIDIPNDDMAFLKRRIELANAYLELLKTEEAKAIPFAASDEPVYEIKQLPVVTLDIDDVARFHREPLKLVEKISIMAGRFVFDMSTSKGRDACRSHSAQIIKCIAPALNASKQIAADAKKVIDADLNFRKHFEKGVREIAELTRQPLTEWEAQQERIVQEAKAEQERLEQLAREELEYQQAHEAALLENELFDLRKEKALREQAEKMRIAEEQRKAHEAQAIAGALKEAQERAEREQQEKAHQAQLEIEKAQQAKLQAEQREKEALQRAELEKQEAVRLERERLEHEQAEKLRIEREEAQRLENRIAVDDEICKALMAHGFSLETAVKIIELAANGQLGRLLIHY